MPRCPVCGSSFIDNFRSHLEVCGGLTDDKAESLTIEQIMEWEDEIAEVDEREEDEKWDNW